MGKIIDASCIEPDVMRLISMKKNVDGEQVIFRAPAPGKDINVPLTAPDEPGIRFVMCVRECRRATSCAINAIVSRKTSMHTRTPTKQLVRIDLDANGKHRNPGNIMIFGPHIHVWSSEYGDKMAYPLGSQNIIPISRDYDVPDVFEAFRAFCGITNDIVIEWSLGV